MWHHLEIRPCRSNQLTWSHTGVVWVLSAVWLVALMQRTQKRDSHKQEKAHHTPELGERKPTGIHKCGRQPYGCLTITQRTADCWQPLELSKRQDSILPWSVQGEHDLGFLTPSELWADHLGFWAFRTVSESVSVGFVMAALGNQYSISEVWMKEVTGKISERLLKWQLLWISTSGIPD